MKITVAVRINDTITDYSDRGHVTIVHVLDYTALATASPQGLVVADFTCIEPKAVITNLGLQKMLGSCTLAPSAATGRAWLPAHPSRATTMPQPGDRHPHIGMTGRLDGLPGHVPDPAMDSQRSADAEVADS